MPSQQLLRLPFLTRGWLFKILEKILATAAWSLFSPGRSGTQIPGPDKAILSRKKRFQMAFPDYIGVDTCNTHTHILNQVSMGVGWWFQLIMTVHFNMWRMYKMANASN